MRDNPLDTLPKDIFAKKYFDERHQTNSRNQLFAYLRSIQEGGQAPHHRAKVMFVGDGEVGKTSLLNCFTDLQYQAPKKRRQTVGQSKSSVDIYKAPEITDGIDISEVHWFDREHDQEIVWDCWDYAGQDIYYTTHQFFLSAGAVYLVVFNLLNRDFSRIEYWLNSVHTRARGSPIILVGTHADDPLCTESYVIDYQKELKNRYLKRFKSSLGVPSIKYIITLSTKPTKKGISEDVRSLMDRIGVIMTNLRLVGKTYPKSWLGLEKHLRTLGEQRKQNPFMTWDEFTSTAMNCHISSEDVAEAAAFLHSSGVLCHFNDEHSGLNDLVILDPQFLTNVMSAVISLRSSFAKSGEILEKDLIHIWRAFDPSLHKTLMGLLERFEIAFALPSNEQGDRYLIPALLPDTGKADSFSSLWGPITSQDNIYQLGRIYVFKFLPLGFFSRLFVRILHLPGVKSDFYWSTGVIVKRDDEKAIIRYNPTEYKLTMHIRGPQDSSSRGQLLRLLIESVETVIEGWYETDVDISVPCSHCVEAGSYSPFMFSMEECAQQVTSGNGRPFVLCRGVRKVRIDAIAPDISFADMMTKRINFKDITLLKVCGVGAFGQVYEAKFSDSLVAVKVLEKQKKEQFSEYDETDDQEFKRFNEFQREVWIMSCIRHEKLVRLVGISTNPPSMIMELLPMGDLYHVLYPLKKPPDSSSSLSTSEVDDPEVNYRKTRLQSWHNTIKSSLELRYRIAMDVAKAMRHLHSLSPPIIHRDLRSPNIFVSNSFLIKNYKM